MIGLLVLYPAVFRRLLMVLVDIALPGSLCAFKTVLLSKGRRQTSVNNDAFFSRMSHDQYVFRHFMGIVLQVQRVDGISNCMV